VLDIVDAQLGGFAVGDRAEMAGNAEAALVGGFNYFFQLRAGDVHEGFEGSDTLICPELCRFVGVFRPVELVDRKAKIAFAFQVSRLNRKSGGQRLFG